MIENTAGVETWWDGQWLRDVRLKRGLQVREVAERAGLNPSSISAVEGGEVASPGLVFMLKVAAAMDVPLSSLIGERQEGEEFHSGYTAALLDMGDALHRLRREHEGD